MSGSQWLLSLLLLERFLAGSPFYAQAVSVNPCGSPSQCDFVCDCWDCSDENHCGYQKEPEALGRAFSCDFEGSACGWQDVSTTAYRWRPGQASTSTGALEPPFDHTLGTDWGWYMTTTTQRAKPLATARLRSPLLQEAAATCEIRAWYHLWGPGLNDTHQSALVLELSQGRSTITLWQSPPGSLYSWRELVAYTGRIQGTFQVIFSSTQSSSEAVQVALDDVQFRNCGFPQSSGGPQSCNPGMFPCWSGSCIAEDRLCDGTIDCRAGEDENHTKCASFTACSFEEGWCGWTVMPGQTLSWLRNSSVHLDPSHAAPTRDHTTNSWEGFFAYVDNQTLGLHMGTTWLASPILEPDTNHSHCQLVLYVHLHGSASNSLSIYTQTPEETRLVWSQGGDLGKYWFREKVDFQIAEKFQIIIEGRIGMGHKGSVAVDDLLLSPNCRVQNYSHPLSPLLEPSQPCPEEQFACGHGNRCISPELVCNFKAECEDGSDEQQCGMTDFASDSGGWRDISVGHLQWSAGKRDSMGSSFHLQEGSGQMISPARAATPDLGPSGLACAVQLDFTPGLHGFLALAITEESLGSRWWAWFATGNGSSTWSKTTVLLGARKRPFQLELLAMEDLDDPQRLPLLSVSRVSFVNCSAESPLAPGSGLSCSFETNWCGWYPEQNDGFEWQLGRSQEWTLDHTTGAGSFLFVDPSAPGTRGLRARLASVPQGPAAATTAATDTCLSFWYRMDGPQIGTLKLLVKVAGESEQVLWVRTGSNGAVWHREASTISSQPGQSYQVIFEALRDGFLGTMALDDIAVTPGACAARKLCSFEADNCGLSATRQPAWQRQNGTRGWGPAADHTLGKPEGHYMILNTSAGQPAILRTQAFSPLRHTHCVAFWYFLSSSDPGPWTVRVEEGGSLREELSLQAAQGEVWQYGHFTVEVQERWQVAFVAGGAGGGPAASYIALDDLLVKEGNCSETGSCDFESGPCGWSKPLGPWNSWDWKAAATPSQSPSPRKDCTLGTGAGHYAYVDVAVLGAGRSAARLASELLPPTPGSCLGFHYHMDFLSQSSRAELKVKLTSQQGERTVWSATGHQGRTWMNHTLYLSSLVDFQIVLEATHGGWASSGTIAMDDISYTDGSDCTSRPKESQEGSSKPSRQPVAGMVAGIGGCLLLALVVALGTTYCLRKRRAAQERIVEDEGSIQGFDNIAFRDDRVILPQMVMDSAAA